MWCALAYLVFQNRFSLFRLFGCFTALSSNSYNFKIAWLRWKWKVQTELSTIIITRLLKSCKLSQLREISVKVMMAQWGHFGSFFIQCAFVCVFTFVRWKKSALQTLFVISAVNNFNVCGWACNALCLYCVLSSFFLFFSSLKGNSKRRAHLQMYA